MIIKRKLILQLEFDTRGRRECVPGFDVQQDLVVRESLEGEAAKSYNFIENDSVAPDIGHGGKKTFCQTFRGHPSHWQHTWKMIDKIKDV